MAFRYLGNKSRLVGAIVDAVRAIVPAGAPVADPMCGTATVAGALASAGHPVLAGDELTFAVQHARVRLLLPEPPPFAALGGYRRVLERLNGLPGVAGFFHREYSDAGRPANGCKPRAYFTRANAARIDAVRAHVNGWSRAGALAPLERDLLHHDLILAVNRVANIAGTYGYYRSKWNPAALQPLELRPTAFTATAGPHHRVVQGKVEETVGTLEAQVVYLDPPYTKRQYAGNYHVLETLAVGDEPEPVGEGGLRDWYGQYSAFCSKRMVHDAFRTVLRQVRAPHVLLSYSEDGLVAPDDLLALLGEFGDVRRQEVEVGRFRSNGGRAGPVTEHLYHLIVSTAAQAASASTTPGAVTV